MKTRIPRTILPLITVFVFVADTQAGRWLSRDPIHDGAGFVQRDPAPQYQFIDRRNEPNIYAFVRNNPLTYIDRLGLQCASCASAQLPSSQSCPIPSSSGNTAPSQSISSSTISNPAGYNDFPSWFNNPADEGKPCCCKPPASLLAFQRNQQISRFTINMGIFVFLSGCYKDYANVWWTCWRPDGTAGIMPQCNNSSSCQLNVAGVTFPYIGNLSTGPHITKAYIRYLSCENGRWVKNIQSDGRTYVWSNGTWTW